MTDAIAVRVSSPTYQAYQILHLAFVVAPVVAGIDKFFHVLTNWDAYLAPIIPNMLGMTAHTFMLGVGLIEMLAGVIVVFAPRIGAWVVGAWLCGIIINLLLLGNYFDVALRDFGLALGALALARLSVEYSEW
jgi:hypothetical protein